MQVGSLESLRYTKWNQMLLDFINCTGVDTQFLLNVTTEKKVCYVGTIICILLKSAHKRGRYCGFLHAVFYSQIPVIIQFTRASSL